MTGRIYRNLWRNQQYNDQLPESRSHQVPDAGVTLQNPSSLAETQGAENSRRDHPLVRNLEEIEVDAISIATLSDLDAEGLD